MADILTILPGVTLDNLDAMTLGDIARWHDRALRRHQAKQADS
ncbi:MAG: GpE family phage tail protein [Pseudomonadota bacterium]